MTDQKTSTGELTYVFACGHECPDYPEHSCTYPEGHGKISEPDEDVVDMDHGDPKGGVWWAEVTSPLPLQLDGQADYQPTAEPRPALCGAVNPDYPEHTCTYPEGHGPVTDTEQDSHALDHGDPERGAYWGVVMGQLPFQQDVQAGYQPTAEDIEAFARDFHESRGDVMPWESKPAVWRDDDRELATLVLQFPAIQAIIRAAQAEAWDRGYGDCWQYHQSNGLAGTERNPFRNETTNE